MSRLFIVRHGNTFAPEEPARRIGASTDMPLVASGIAQAQALGRHFADRKLAPKRILSSPLRRTMRTALLISEALGCPSAPEPAEWLKEIDHGPDEDRPESAVIARIGRPALHDWDRHALAPAGWTVNAPQRVAAWKRLFATESAGDTIVVTSNGMARFALVAAFSERATLSLSLRTGAYGEFVLLAAGACDLIDWDRRPESGDA